MAARQESLGLLSQRRVRLTTFMSRCARRLLDYVQSCVLHKAAVAVAAAASEGHLPESIDAGSILEASCGVARSAASSPPGLLLHLISRGLFLMVGSLVAGAASSLLMLKYNKKMHDQGQARQEGMAASYLPHMAAFLPMETFGLDYGATAALQRTAAVMRWLRPAMGELVRSSAVSFVIPIACLPIGLYYWIRLLLARVAPEASRRMGSGGSGDLRLP